MGVLCVVEGKYKGMHLAIEELGLAFAMKPGDVLLFNTKLLLGNTA